MIFTMLMSVLRFLILLSVVVFVVSLIKIIMHAGRKSTIDQGRRTKIIDSTVRDVKKDDYREKRLKILEQMQSGKITLDDAQRQLDELDR